MDLLRLLIFWIIFVFLCFPSNAYDEKIKLNRTDNKIISGKTKIKINLNNMLNFRELKQINIYYASIEHSVKKISEEIRNKSDRPIYRGVFTDNVKATVYMRHNKGMGAGSIIKRNGKLFVLTNWHVIDGAKGLKVFLYPEDTTKKEEYNLWDTEDFFIGEVIKTNKKKDLALIKVKGFPKNTKVITLGTIGDIIIGETAHAIGHPEGSTWSFNTGYINQIRPDHRWRYESSRHHADVIQHQIPISPGNSGGPLLNKYGKLIGVNSYSHEDGQNLNFAIAINDVIEFLEQEQVVEDKPTCKDNNGYITKKCKGKTWITIKCKDKISYITKKCKDKKMSANGKNIMKTYPNALSSDANNNEIDDTWYVDTDNNGKIDIAFIDNDEDGVIEAVMLDDNENNIWEIIIGDKDLDGNPDVAIIDRDEDGKGDVIAYDYDQDGEWDKFEQIG